jgi:type II secretory pathway pseudopilin PulG
MLNCRNRSSISPSQITVIQMRHRFRYNNTVNLKRLGFTYIDLLLAIAIIACAIALLIPAVQAFREKSRRTQCINNLQKMGGAVQTHTNYAKHFPTGGWGRRWIGDNSRGIDADQPGGWAYMILPYMGHAEVRGGDGNRNEITKMKQLAGRRMIEILLREFICPSRREAVLYPYYDYPYNAFKTKTNTSAHTDYAINRGDVFVSAGDGPKTYADSKYKWPDTSTLTGISFVRSTIQPKDVIDGLECTYLIGEKYLNPENYTNGKDEGDNGCLYQGDDPDIARCTEQAPIQDVQEGWEDYKSFGSAHPSTWQAVFCDGSVHNMSFDIDPDVHRQLGNRKDGKKPDATQY